MGAKIRKNQDKEKSGEQMQGRKTVIVGNEIFVENELKKSVWF